MKIRATCFWEHDEALKTSLEHYSFGDGKWKDMELVTGSEYDLLVILTRPHKDCMNYNPSKAITLLTEPPQSPNIKEHLTSAIIPMYLPLPFWKELSPQERKLLSTFGVKKQELLSSVTSELGFMEGHFKRIQLISLLDKVVDEGFDLWGKKYTNQFLITLRNYKGELVNKYQALWSYRYHFACENSFNQNYFTEKIVDPIIAESLCFYDGCINIEEFIDERAFIRVNVNEPMSVIDSMIKAMQENQWRKRVKYIRQQKERFTSTLNPLNIIWMSAKGMDVLKECKI